MEGWGAKLAREVEAPLNLRGASHHTTVEADRIGLYCLYIYILCVYSGAEFSAYSIWCILLEVHCSYSQARGGLCRRGIGSPYKPHYRLYRRGFDHGSYKWFTWRSRAVINRP